MRTINEVFFIVSASILTCMIYQRLEGPDLDVAVAATRQVNHIRTVTTSEQTMTRVTVGPGGTILSFAAKPSKVILGKKKAYDVQYIESDIALAPLPGAEPANLFVYVLGKRYGFVLEPVRVGGDDVLMVRDESEGRIEVRIEDQ